MNLKKINILDTAKHSISQQIDALQIINQKLGKDFVSGVEMIANSKGKLILVGIGKSAHICNKIVATLNSTGTRAQFLHASEAIHGDLGLIEKKDICLVLSKSGNTPEILSLLPSLKILSSGIISITSNVKSVLAENSDFVWDVSIEKEACPNNLAPTTSTTAQLVMGDAMAIVLMGLKNFGSNDFAVFHPGGALGKKLLLKVEDVISEEKPSVELEDKIQEVIISLSNGKHGITPVFDGNRIVGVITDGDLRRALNVHSEFLSLTAKDMMSSKPKKIQKSILAKDALAILRENQIGQLIVEDENEYCGILNLYDLLNLGLE